MRTRRESISARSRLAVLKAEGLPSRARPKRGHGRALYAPWDRVGLAAHGEWAGQYRNYAWHPGRNLAFLHGAHHYETLNIDLRSPNDVVAPPSSKPQQPFNPGFTTALLPSTEPTRDGAAKGGST